MTIPQNVRQTLLGFALVAFAFAMFTVLSAAARGCSANLSVLEILFFRQVITLLLVGATIFVSGNFALLHTKQLGLQTLRTFLGTTSLVFLVLSYKALPVGDATALTFSYGLFLALLTPYLLNEPLATSTLIGVIVGFLGVVFVADPTGDVNLAGVLYGLAGGLFDALSMMVVRQLTKRDEPLTILFCFAALSVILTGGCLLLANALGVPAALRDVLGWGIPTQQDTTLLLVIGVAGWLGQMAITYAAKFVSPVDTAPMSYTAILWAILIGYAYWGRCRGGTYSWVVP